MLLRTICNSQLVNQCKVAGCIVRPCHSSGSLSLGSRSGQSSGICGGQRGTGTGFLGVLRFLLSVSLYLCSIFTHVSSEGWTKGPLVTAVPVRRSLIQPQQGGQCITNSSPILLFPLLYVINLIAFRICFIKYYCRIREFDDDVFLLGCDAV
jgi:hypothetical protein